MSAVLQKESGGSMHPSATYAEAAFGLFLGVTPAWYKKAVIAILVLNPLLLLAAGPFVAGWAMVAEFIFFLAMALSAYPLLPGGLLVIEALALKLATPEGMYNEAHHNFPVIMLLMFIVAGVYFLQDWLKVVFRAVLLALPNKIAVSLAFSIAGAVLSAFLDALTVISVVITVGVALNTTYNSYRSQQHVHDDIELEQFRAFMRSLVMHAAVGTMLGGVLTKVGEPQNLLIAHVMESTLPPEYAQHWTFFGFFIHMLPVTGPTFLAGLTTVFLVEKYKVFGYGAAMPATVRRLLEREAREEAENRTKADVVKLAVQTVCAILLVVGLALHLAEVGILGLFLIVLTTTFTGVDEEHKIGKAFTASLPFCALLVVFFGIVDVIAAQKLFAPVVELALGQEAKGQQLAFYASSGILSAISDNVFVATVFINEATAAYKAGLISPEQFEFLAISINAGTNIPSIATPNGQAAFLFLLTSPLAPLIMLGYGRMVKMALPYFVVVTIVSVLATWLLL